MVSPSVMLISVKGEGLHWERTPDTRQVRPSAFQRNFPQNGCQNKSTANRDTSNSLKLVFQCLRNYFHVAKKVYERIRTCTEALVYKSRGERGSLERADSYHRQPAWFPRITSNVYCQHTSSLRSQRPLKPRTASERLSSKCRFYCSL